MNYWKVQVMVSEYTCPVKVTSGVLAELSATDVFNAKRESIAELEEYCAIVQQLCRSARLFQNQTVRSALQRL